MLDQDVAAAGRGARVASRCRRSPARRSRTPTIVYQNSLNTDAPVVLVPSWITVSPVGRITSLKHRLVRFGLLEQVERVVHDAGRGSAIAGLQRRRAACPAPAARTAAAPARSTGVTAVIVAGVSRTPGRDVAREALEVGQRRVQARRASRARSRAVGPSSPIASVRFCSARGEDREEAVEVRDQVLQLLLVGAERGRRPCRDPRSACERSCGSVPSSALLTCAEPFSDAGA